MKKAMEKMNVYGPKSLSDLEVLEAVVGNSGGARSLWDMCENGISDLNGMSAIDFMKVEGVGAVTAMKIYASIELGRRMLADYPQEDKEAMSSPHDVVRFLRASFQGMEQEKFISVGLDARQKVMTVRTVGIGTLSSVDVHPRELFRDMIRNGVHSCILAHNHPSGSCEPSPSDIELTDRMCQVGRLVGIPVLDHIIFTDNDSVSLASLGLLQ